MAGQRGTIEFTVEGQKIAALTAGLAAGPAAGVVADGGGDRGKPLIAALPGGTYTARYFDTQVLITAGPRSRWSAPTSTWRGPATASPLTAWP